MSFWGQMGFMDPSSPLMEEMIMFHDHAMSILVAIFVFVVLIGCKFTFSSYSSRLMIENHMLETIWTIVPAIVLILLAGPSLVLLYLLDDVPSEGLMLKVVGSQWYWTTESGNNTMTECYLKSDSLVRNLEVDSPIILRAQLNYSSMVTSSDVLHSFAVPSFAIKVDAVPGRLNVVNFFPNYPGVYYGQCSEICGANHAFMPIEIKVK
uniref:Cytochrome c oxidase subunit 2 n=2 Tax=unclassified Physidae TaxID=1724862 RepID=A0A8F8SPC0_9GAST|nr:cytochrome c oxidase subunit II [Physidae sp. PE4]QYB18823.1 cytochrome c oxidase subunit 2 [Physidae sp. P3S_19]